MSGDEDGSVEQDLERWEAIADLFTAMAHPVRVAILESLAADEERPLTEVADAFGYSRSAIQKHVETLEEKDAVYRPEEGDRTYALTPFGRYFASMLVRDGDELMAAVDRVAEAEEQAADELEDVPLGETALEKAKRERTWELVDNELVELLVDEDD